MPWKRRHKSSLFFIASDAGVHAEPEKSIDAVRPLVFAGHVFNVYLVSRKLWRVSPA